MAHWCHSPCQRVQRWKRKCRFRHYLAFDMVAIEIPVDPTVPSKIREPVFGCNNPCRSASSITATDASALSRSSRIHTVFSLRKATRSLTLPPGFRNWVQINLSYCERHVESPTSAFPRISTPSASLNELILTNGVFPDPLNNICVDNPPPVTWR